MRPAPSSATFLPPGVFRVAPFPPSSAAPQGAPGGFTPLRFWGDVRAGLPAVPALGIAPDVERSVPLAFDPPDGLEQARAANGRTLADQSESVVLIEDDPATLILLRDVLLAAGIPVLPFASGFEALSSLERSVPGLLILDWHLPQMNGRAVIDHLHAYLGRLPPVLVLTGDVRLKAASHVTEVIRKPLSLERLVERVRTLMSLP